MAKKVRTFAKGFAQGFAPWAFVVLPMNAAPPPQVSLGTAWIQTGNSLRSAIRDYERAGKHEETKNKESA